MRARAAAVVVALVVVGTGLLAGCSSSDSKTAEEKVCDARSQVKDAVQKVADDVQSGSFSQARSDLSEVRSSFQSLRSAVQELNAQKRSEVQSDLNDAKQALTNITVSGGGQGLQESLSNARAALDQALQTITTTASCSS